MRVAAQHSLEEGRAGGENNAVRLQPGLPIKTHPKKTKKHLKNQLKMGFLGFLKMFYIL